MPQDRRAQVAPNFPEPFWVTDENCNLEGVLFWQSREEVSVTDKIVAAPWDLTDIINGAIRL